MGKQLLICGTVLFWSLGVVQAGVGDLKYVEGGMDSDHFGSADQATEFMVSAAGDFSKPTPGCGTKNPHALVVSLILGDRPLKVAIDTREAEDKLPNLLRFDFSGKGKFDDVAVVPIALEGIGEGYMANANATLKVERNGRQIPVQVAAIYYRPNKETRFFRLSAQVMAKSDCTFGDKSYKVRFLDTSGNLEVQKPTGPYWQKDKPVAVPSVGTMLVEFADHSSRKNIKAFIGQPVQVDGAWYDVVVDTQAMKVTAKKIEAPAGKIHVAHDDWSAVLVGQNNMLNLAGGQEPVNVPPDTYIVKEYREWGKIVSKPPPRANFESSISKITSKPYTVKADTITELAIGSPLTASVTAEVGDDYKQEGKCEFTLNLRDSSGAEVNSLRLANGKRPPPPKFKVLNATGEEVYAATMGYG